MSTSIIIVLHNDDPTNVIKTIDSILKISNDYLSEIVLIDDFSFKKVTEWNEWIHSERLKHKIKINIIRTEHYIGNTASKHYATSKISKLSKVIMFLEPYVIVSEYFLVPLLTTLADNPNSIVYPSIDVLTIDQNQLGLIKSDDVVAGFDWSLNLRWESIDSMNSISQLPLIPKDYNSDLTIASPITPDIFAITTNYYETIGGFDTELTTHESLELSLRIWQCGGTILRNPCSRVAKYYSNLIDSSLYSLHSSITENEINTNIFSITERYFRINNYKEIVFQSKYYNKIPYLIDLSQSTRVSSLFLNNKLLTNDKCLDFNWYLNEIYPKLLLETNIITKQFSYYITTNYLEKSFYTLINNYFDKSNIIIENTSKWTNERTNTKEEELIQSTHDLLIPKKLMYIHPNEYLSKNIDINIINNNHLIELKRIEFEKKLNELIGKTVNSDSHEIHANKIRETLICEDEPFESTVINNCNKRIQDDNNACIKQKGYMMFGCPKTCNLCGIDGKICYDFYDKKCIDWKNNGRCESEHELMAYVCRKTCNICIPTDNTITKEVNLVEKSEILDNNEPKLSINEPINSQNELQNEILHEDLHEHNQLNLQNNHENENENEIIQTGMNPYIAQNLLKSLKIIDVGNNIANKAINCQLNEKPNGELLSRIHIHSESQDTSTSSKKIKIFCGIYTMESNHQTNVLATRDTWGKKCDGFIAFSTKEDMSIPSINIEHEGAESYNNMWQKSRSIWKYIAKHYINQFDYFLLGKCLVFLYFSIIYI